MNDEIVILVNKLKQCSDDLAGLVIANPSDAKIRELFDSIEEVFIVVEKLFDSVDREYGDRYAIIFYCTSCGHINNHTDGQCDSCGKDL